MKRKHSSLVLGQSLVTVVGLVLVWRGIWYLLDAVDKAWFNGGHALTALVGVGLGLLLLYLPDKDLKEIQKL